MPEEVEENRVVVYCNQTECAWNKQIKGLNHTETEIRNSHNPSKAWKPTYGEENQKVWNSVCGRDEVVIDMSVFISSTGARQKLPACFTPMPKKSGRPDMSQMMGEMYHIEDPDDRALEDSFQWDHTFETNK